MPSTTRKSRFSVVIFSGSSHITGDTKKTQWHESRADQHKEQISYIAQENNTVQNV